MLSFKTSDGFEIVWHTGEPKPEIWQTLEANRKEGWKPRTIVRVYADDDEFNYLVGAMRNLPYNSVRHSGTWEGEWATFIYDNL